MKWENSQENAQEWGGPEMAPLKLLKTMDVYMRTNDFQVRKKSWTLTVIYYNQFAVKYEFRQRTEYSMKSKWSKMEQKKNISFQETFFVQFPPLDLPDTTRDFEDVIPESLSVNQTHQIRILIEVWW